MFYLFLYPFIRRSNWIPKKLLKNSRRHLTIASKKEHVHATQHYKIPKSSRLQGSVSETEFFPCTAKHNVCGVAPALLKCDEVSAHI